MNPVASLNRWRPTAPPDDKTIRLGIAPDVLRQAGILTNPRNPEQSYRRAKALAKQGRYREARALICPHARLARGTLKLRITELLAQCAMYDGGGDWEKLLNAALEGYLEARDTLGIARTRRDLGEMFMNVGRLREADLLLRDSAAGFVRAQDPACGAMVDCLRARIRLRAGHISKALQRVDDAIRTLERVGHPQNLALARLDRARICAHRGDAAGAARDLLSAEHFLGTSGNAFDRLHARITRAECLLHLGEPRRASTGLKRVLAAVIDLEEVAIRGWVHSLLGQALSSTNPEGARGFLMRARHLFEKLEYDYHVAECDVALARVENRVGLNAQGRLKQLKAQSLADWPRLSARAQIARAEISGEQDPDRARLALFRARSFATESGDRSLLTQIDRALRSCGLMSEEEADQLTPIDSLTTAVKAHVAATTVPDGKPLPRIRPEPFEVHESHGLGVVTAREPRQAALFISPSAARNAAISIEPPKAVGVGRA